MEDAELSNNLRNLLQSTRGGILLKRLDAEFYTFAKVHIPLGAHKDLEELLRTMPDICSIRKNDRGQLMVQHARSRGQKTATVVSGASADSGGSNKKRTPPRNPTKAPVPSNNYETRPRPGPSGRFPRRLPQTKQQPQQNGRGDRNHSHGHGETNGNWRNSARPPISSGNNGDVSSSMFNGAQRKGNLVWVNPSLQNSSNGGHRNVREYRDRPNAIPIVDPRSRRVISFREQQQQSSQQPSGARTAAAPTEKTSHAALLIEYAKATGIPPPEFQVMESKPNKKASVEFLCTVELDGKKYKSYPLYRATAELAKDEAAFKALSELGITEETLKQRVAEKQATLPLMEMSTPEQIEAVVSNLLVMLDKRPNGVFCNSVPQIFAEEFKLNLPADWQVSVAENELLSVVSNPVAKLDVLYKKVTTPTAVPQVPPLCLTEENFTFTTILIVDVDNFYGRVEREDYHTLTASMAEYYKEEANIASQKLDPTDKPIVGALYALFDQSWHRVQCVSAESGSESAEYRYVDLGITEPIAHEKLMHLAYEFYSVPFLAIQLKLEEFGESNVSDSKRPTVVAHMERLMKDKILWAVPSPGTNLSERPLPVKVYDTGSSDANDGDEQVDINKEIYKLVTTPGIFPAPVIAKGYLSFVSPSGDIYLQIDDFGLQELRSLKVEPATEKHVESVQPDRVYCSQLENNWHRCVAKNIISDSEIDIQFIDYGNKTTVSIEKIFPLKTGFHLEDLPPQAVKTHMTDFLPEDLWSDEEIARITELCPEEQLLIIKVSANPRCQGRNCDESIQHVDIFKRTLPNDELISVNLTLCEEFKIEMPNATETNGVTQNGRRKFSGLETLQPLAPVYPKCSPPAIGSTISIQVLSAASPNQFICQPFSTLSEFANLRAQMQLFYGKQENRSAVGDFAINEGGFFACLRDEIWERAYVEKVSGAPNNCTTVVCLFVDNGAYLPLSVTETSIQPLHEQFRQLPYQMIKAGLHKVCPKKGAADFDPMDCITFQKHITGRDLQAKIWSFEVDSRISVAPTFSLTVELYDEEQPLIDLYTEMKILEKRETA